MSAQDEATWAALDLAIRDGNIERALSLACTTGTESFWRAVCLSFLGHALVTLGPSHRSLRDLGQALIGHYLDACSLEEVSRRLEAARQDMTRQQDHLAKAAAVESAPALLLMQAMTVLMTGSCAREVKTVAGCCAGAWVAWRALQGWSMSKALDEVQTDQMRMLAANRTAWSTQGNFQDGQAGEACTRGENALRP